MQSCVPVSGRTMTDTAPGSEKSDKTSSWYDACETAAKQLEECIPHHYRSRTFPGILGDIKALSPRKALSLINRKKGLGRQYACLYLSQGIDGGRGYQACAAEALASVTGSDIRHIINGRILDVGCAVGVTAGVLGLDGVTGFDLFTDLLGAAQMVDAITGRHNRYVTADMTRSWPFANSFDTVVCGLVCHHLKQQHDIVTFFSEANRVMKTGGHLVLTLPSGSVAFPEQLDEIVSALEEFGFTADRELCGLVISTDSPHALFWMFVIVARKVSDGQSGVFINPGFGFHLYRTPVTRVEKGKRARSTALADRKVKHAAFLLIPLDILLTQHGKTVLVYENITALPDDT